MKILVTGATGFIGSNLIQHLLNQGLTVIACSRDVEKAKAFNWFHKVIFIPFDLQKSQNIKNYYTYFQEPDILVHLAWSGLPSYKSTAHFEENLMPSYHFIKNLVVNGLHKVTVTGTCLEYGFQEGSLKEDLPSKPSNAYALAKDTLRKQLEELKKESNFSLKWVRLFYMFGEGQNPKSILPLLDKALKEQQAIFNMSGGEQLRDYLPVNKVVEYLSKIALSEKLEGIINCCSGQPISIRRLVEEHLKAKKKSIHLNLGYYPYADYEPMAFWGDNNKLKKALNND